MTRDFTPRVLAGRAGASLDRRRSRRVTASTTPVPSTPTAIIDLIDAAGLRGRGGAGFPVARKWRTVVANRTALMPSTVVVNAAEGEPGSFKDRAILRADPYRVLEGALIAAHAVGADSVIVATKASFTREVRAPRGAPSTRSTRAGWTDARAGHTGHRTRRVPLRRGDRAARGDRRPSAVPAHRAAVPRRRRRGVRARVRRHVGQPARPRTSRWRVPSPRPSRRRRSPGTSRPSPTSPASSATGADWFRELGTADSPGTVVCTVSGDTVRAGVAEVELGTPLREVIERARWRRPPRPRDGRGACRGSPTRCCPRSAFDTPLSYEAMRERRGRARRGRVHRLRRHHRPGRGRRRRGALPRGRVVRSVPPLQGRRPRARRAPGRAGRVGAREPRRRRDRAAPRPRRRGCALQPRDPAAGRRGQRASTDTPTSSTAHAAGHAPAAEPVADRRAASRSVDGRAVARRGTAHEAARLDPRRGRLRAVARRPPRRPPRRRATIR